MRVLGTLLGIFVSPVDTLTRATASGAWGKPFVALLVVAVAANGAVLASVGIGNFTRQAIPDSQQAEQLAAHVEASTAAQSVIYAGAAIFPAALVLGLTGVFVMLATVGGLPLTPRQILTVVAYTCFAYFTVTGALTALTAWLVEHPADFDVRQPFASSLGDLLSADANPVLRAIAHAFDLFTAVAMALLATGFCAASARLRPATAWGMVFGVWAAYAGSRAVLAAF